MCWKSSTTGASPSRPRVLGPPAGQPSRPVPEQRRPLPAGSFLSEVAAVGSPGGSGQRGGGHDTRTHYSRAGVHPQPCHPCPACCHIGSPRGRVKSLVPFPCTACPESADSRQHAGIGSRCGAAPPAWREREMLQQPRLRKPGSSNRLLVCLLNTRTPARRPQGALSPTRASLGWWERAAPCHQEAEPSAPKPCERGWQEWGDPQTASGSCRWPSAPRVRL